MEIFSRSWPATEQPFSGSFPPDNPATRTFPKQRANVSYGIGSNGSLGFFRPSTPNTANGPAFAGVVVDTRFSHDHGFYDTNILVAITTETPGATIRFTTDGNPPSANSGVIYSAPIVISKTTILRAAAFREGWAPCRRWTLIPTCSLPMWLRPP